MGEFKVQVFKVLISGYDGVYFTKKPCKDYQGYLKIYKYTGTSQLYLDVRYNEDVLIKPGTLYPTPQGWGVQKLGNNNFW